MASSSLARKNMLDCQILTGNILSPSVLGALSSVARETFVPDAFRGVAYVDEQIALGQERFLTEPLAFARLLELAAIMPQDNVLVIGSASGYAAAVISQLARQVVAVEENEELLAQAAHNLKNYTNIMLHTGPLAQGEHSHAPYDVIVIDGAIERLPQPLNDQLREGARLVAFEREAKPHIGITGLCALVEYTKLQNTLFRKSHGNANVSVLPGFAAPQRFVF